MDNQEQQTKPKSFGTVMNWHKRLEATRIFACPSCQAPGVFQHGQTEEEITHFKKWPGCYVENADIRKGKPVGDICPNCHEPRSPHENLGVIWEK